MSNFWGAYQIYAHFYMKIHKKQATFDEIYLMHNKVSPYHAVDPLRKKHPDTLNCAKFNAKVIGSCG